MVEPRETIKTKIWQEEAADDNPFAADRCYCSGYDVYGDLLGKVSWIQYLYLLFKLDLPTEKQARLLETIAVSIANPGIRDHSVRAAMNAGVGGSTRASSLIAALSVGAGNLNGGQEVVQMIRWWARLGEDLERWTQAITIPPEDENLDVWFPMEHIPGFDPNGATCPKPVRQTLDRMAEDSPGVALRWLQGNRESLEELVGYPLAMSGVIATAFFDLNFTEGEAEIAYLLLRLPGAAAHALEQEKHGWKKYPFFGEALKPMSKEDYSRLLHLAGVNL